MAIKHLIRKMKQFKDLKVGDKVLKSFTLKKPLEGFHNYCVIATVTEIEPDPNDDTMINVWCKFEDGTNMEFDLFPSDMDTDLIYDNNETLLEVYAIV